MSSQVPTGKGLQKRDMMTAVRDIEVDREVGGLREGGFVMVIGRMCSNRRKW
jgi:hypothetical protein